MEPPAGSVCMSLRIFSKPAIAVLTLASVGTVMYRKLYQDRCSRTLGTWLWRLIGQMATSTVPKHKNLPVTVEVGISGDYYWAVLDMEI